MGIPAPIGLATSGLPNTGDQANAVLSGQLTGVGPTPAFAFRGPMNLAIWASLVATLTTTSGSLAATLNSATGLAAGASINSVNLPGGSVIGVLSGTNVTLGLTPRSYRGVFSGNTVTMNYPADRLLGSTITIDSTASGLTLPAGTTVIALDQTYIAATPLSSGQPAIITLSAAPSVSPSNPNQLVPFTAALTGNAVEVTGADAAAVFTGAGVSYSGTVQLERSFDGGRTWICCNVGGSGQLAQYSAGTPVSITFGEPEKQVLYRLNCIAYTSGTINYRISQTGGAAESLAIGPLSQG
jgi:hypothetical protein